MDALHYIVYYRNLFLGQVTIEFYVEKEMSFIVLHAQNLNITEKVKEKLQL